MRPLPPDVGDRELIEFIDGWAALLEREHYAAAFAYTDHPSGDYWSPGLLRQAISDYADPATAKRVTVDGRSTDVAQRKEVDRWPARADGCFGQIWYDLNLDGVVSDLTATFDLVRGDDGVLVRLSDIHVM